MQFDFFNLRNSAICKSYTFLKILNCVKNFSFKEIVYSFISNMNGTDYILKQILAMQITIIILIITFGFIGLTQKYRIACFNAILNPLIAVSNPLICHPERRAQP